MNNKSFIIAKYTFKELLKSKILYISAFLGFLIMLVTFVATEFTYGVPEKVALDFGLGLLSYSSFAISIFMGATLLSKEIDSRTVYMVISRPVHRWSFISGKIIGLVAILSINLMLLSSMTLICSSLLGGSVNQLIFIAIFFNLLESILLLLVVVFFSLFLNNILASVVSILILILGHAVQDAQSFLFVQNRPVFQTALKFYQFILPAFYKLNFKDFVIYSQSIDLSYIGLAFLYVIIYGLSLYIAINYIFNAKNLD